MDINNLTLNKYKGQNKQLLDLNIGKIRVEKQEGGYYYTGHVLGKDMYKIYNIMEDDCDDGSYAHLRDVEELNDHVYFVQFFQ